jgi:hypothetical protein
LTCAKVNSMLKKTIKPLVCIRYKVSELRPYRSGGLNYTTRFTGAATEKFEMADIAIEFPNERPRVIWYATTYCSLPIRLRVRRFTPKEGDQTHRSYVVNGETRREMIATYCLDNIVQTTKDFKAHIKEKAIQGLSLLDSAESIVIKTRDMILEHHDKLTQMVRCDKSLIAYSSSGEAKNF